MGTKGATTVLLLAAAVLAGCGGSEETAAPGAPAVASTPAGTTVPTSSPTPTTTAAPTTSEQAVVTPDVSREGVLSVLEEVFNEGGDAAVQQKCRDYQSDPDKYLGDLSSNFAAQFPPPLTDAELQQVGAMLDRSCA